MPCRFQFSLRRLIGTVTLFSVAGALATVTHDSDNQYGPLALAAAYGFMGAAIGLFLTARAAVGAVFGATLGLIAFGFFVLANIRIVE